MIIDHNNPEYRKIWDVSGKNQHNGAYYYSVEIVRDIIPNIKTDRNWVTINARGQCCDHSIVFIHNNQFPSRYDWLKEYKDLILVCGVETTCDKVKHLGTPIYLPLSVNVKEVERYKAKKTKDTAFVGRRTKRSGIIFPSDTDYLEDMSRNKLLKEMAKYENVYAVGRCAIEAKILGCNVLPYDDRYPDPDIWKILDNQEAVSILQNKLDLIDRR